MRDTEGKMGGIPRRHEWSHGPESWSPESWSLGPRRVLDESPKEQWSY